MCMTGNPFNGALVIVAVSVSVLATKLEWLLNLLEGMGIYFRITVLMLLVKGGQ